MMEDRAKIAIVLEDELDLADFYRRGLERLGFFVEVYYSATDASAGIETLERELEGRFRVDLALIDGNASDHRKSKVFDITTYSGVNFAVELQRKYPEASIFCVSGYDLSKETAMVGVAFKQKPVSLQDIGAMASTVH
jgi:ActR/RegA family two-component response regulator